MDNKIICPKCNSELPPDSRFCQYCGSIIENSSSTIDNTVKENNAPAAEDVVKTENESETVAKILASGIVEGQKAMEVNKESQPHNELDADFGLVPHKPIYTVGIDEQEKYLKSLRTINGEPIKWNRRGSMNVDGVNGMVDVYDTYMPSREEYKTIYINMYGASTSTFVPKGFSLCSPTSTTISRRPQKSSLSSKIFNKRNIALIVVSFVLLVSLVVNVIMAVTIADYERAYNINWTKIEEYEDLVEKYKKENAELKKGNEQYYEYWSDTFEQIAFYDKFVVFVEDDGTNYYHKYECYKFKGDYFWAFNIDAAKDEGYKACPYCH